MQKRLSESFAAASIKELSPDIWDRLMATLEARLGNLEELKPSLEAALNELLQVGLVRIDETLAPAIADINNAAQLGFLVATSDTSQTLSIGVINLWIVPPGPVRKTFAPGPLAIIQRTGDHDVWAILERQSYNPLTGGFNAKVIAMSAGAVATPGPHTDWVIGAPAGSTLAQMAMLEEGKLVRDASVAAGIATAADRTAVAADKATVANDRSAAAAAASAAAGSATAAAASAAAAAQFDPSSYYSKTQVDAKDAAIVGGASSSFDTLGKVETTLRRADRARRRFNAMNFV